MKKNFTLLLVIFTLIACGQITAQTLTNIALNKPVTVSSVENSSYPGSYAVDGNATTRWSSEYWKDPQTIDINLGGASYQNFTIERVKIRWEAAYAKDYKIQVKAYNGVTTDWKDIKTVTGNTSLVNDWTGLVASGAELRILCTSRAINYGYSIFEIEVYGKPNALPGGQLTSPAYLAQYQTNASIPFVFSNASDPDGSISKVEFYVSRYSNGQYAGEVLIGTDYTAPYSLNWSTSVVGEYYTRTVVYDNYNLANQPANRFNRFDVVAGGPNIALNKPVTVSSVESSAYAGSYAVDGVFNSRWSSQYSDNQWIYVDLQALYNVSEVKVLWESASAYNFQVQVSTNNINWTTVGEVWYNESAQNTFSNLSAQARYVKIYCINRKLPYGYSIHELEVKGTYISPSARLADAEEATQTDIVLYPNPAKGEFNIDFTANDLSAEYKVTILDQYSKIIKSFEKTSSQSVIAINSSSLSNGIYFIRIDNGKNTITKRMVISN